MPNKPIFVLVLALLAGLAPTLAACGQAQMTDANGANGANGAQPCVRHGSAFGRPCVGGSAPRVKQIGIAEPDLIAKPARVQASELAAMKAIGIVSIRLEADRPGLRRRDRGHFRSRRKMSIPACRYIGVFSSWNWIPPATRPSTSTSRAPDAGLLGDLRHRH